MGNPAGMPLVLTWSNLGNYLSILFKLSLISLGIYIWVYYHCIVLDTKMLLLKTLTLTHMSNQDLIFTPSVRTISTPSTGLKGENTHINKLSLKPRQSRLMKARNGERIQRVNDKHSRNVYDWELVRNEDLAIKNQIRKHERMIKRLSKKSNNDADILKHTQAIANLRIKLS